MYWNCIFLSKNNQLIFYDHFYLQKIKLKGNVVQEYNHRKQDSQTIAN